MADAAIQNVFLKRKRKKKKTTTEVGSRGTLTQPGSPGTGRPRQRRAESRCGPAGWRP